MKKYFKIISASFWCIFWTVSSVLTAIIAVNIIDNIYEAGLCVFGYKFIAFFPVALLLAGAVALVILFGEILNRCVNKLKSAIKQLKVE